MAKKNIYDKDLLYDGLRPIVDWCIRHSYRKIEIRGEENLPDDGPFILAVNHCNTLMDALVMLGAYKGATVF
jgi:1-acyl-sn-glycerol-3-phosphate acyltransferase